MVRGGPYVIGFGAFFHKKAVGTTATELNGHGALPPCLFLAYLREDRVRRLL